MIRLTERFKKLYRKIGITKGTIRTPLQYSYDSLTSERKTKLIEFYSEYEKGHFHSVDNFIDTLKDLGPENAAYIWLTKDNIRTTVHGYSILDQYNRVIEKEVSKDITDAKIVNFCTKELLK